MITLIPSSKLEAHPDNPRKYLGDPVITEERAWLDGTHECFSLNGAVQEGDA